MSDQIPVSSPTPDPPPAAQVVIHGQKSEREAALERELAEERERRKAREIELAHLQDENHRLKSVGLSPASPTSPAPRKSGWTFFDDED